MKKLGYFLFTIILSLSFIGCKNETINSNTEVHTNDTNTEIKQNKILEKEYKIKVDEVLKDLYTRIDFDYTKALKDHDIEFLGFDDKDITEAEKIFNNSKEKYSKIKDNGFKDINDKIENILSIYQKVIDGRKLVLVHKNDTKFLQKGYSENVVLPINDVKKALDEFKNLKDDITNTK
jgi:hypothetical protein